MSVRSKSILSMQLVLAAGLTMACGAKRDTGYTAQPTAAEQPGQAQPSALQEKQASAEALWAQRADPTKLREAIAAYEAIVAAQPADRTALARLSRGYYLLAYGHLTTEEEILATYDKGATWGERILGLNPEFNQRVAGGEDDYKALDTTSKEDVPGIYWAYANLGKWSVLKGFTTVLKYKSKLKAFIDRVAELDPQFYYGAGDRGLGAFYAKAPAFAGGDLEKSKAHFERSLQIAPDYFGTKVLMAEYYAVKAQDRLLFDHLLKEVIAADPNVLPDALAIQQIEQRKAKELLERADDLFE